MQTDHLEIQACERVLFFAFVIVCIYSYCHKRRTGQHAGAGSKLEATSGMSKAFTVCDVITPYLHF